MSFHLIHMKIFANHKMILKCNAMFYVAIYNSFIIVINLSPSNISGNDNIMQIMKQLTGESCYKPYFLVLLARDSIVISTHKL